MSQPAAPLVSVIIPAFHARAFIADAVHSVVAQRDAPEYEVLISPDDGADYGPLQALGPAVRVLPPAGHHGVAAARNRALDAARGQIFALCDADDLWPTNYLATLVPLAVRQDVACANTRYTEWDGTAVRASAVAGPRLTLAACARCLASIRPVWNRTLRVRFQDVFAEDVLHVLHLVALQNSGVALAADTHYQVRIRPGSITNAGMQREREILSAYAPLIDTATACPAKLGLEVLPPVRRGEIVDVLRFWRFVNAEYLAAGCKTSFMHYVAGREAALWEAYAGASFER
ncbi:MAG: glycosyltransferase family 2 protein [Nevskiaceae bacterium]|nr:MAG: glycosyltransferase family 2 protein [Nevskiaceae bacterium]TBR75119.1 MAG: glycosyltransferase family 2 protein [Nevskiaceae bacterium]